MKFLIQNIQLIIILVITSMINSQPFSGITYSPYSINGCLDSNTIISELKAISKYTQNIRLYSADCNQVDTILKIISQYQLPLKVQLGIWTRSGQTRFQAETQAVIKGIQTYNKLITRVTVGNEELFNGVQENELINSINYVRQQFQKNSINNIPITTNEVHNLWSTNLAKNCDIIMPTVYPYYAPSLGDGSAATAAKAGIENIQQMAQKLNTNKPIIIGETGFPSNGSAPTQFSLPSINNMCSYLAHFKCLADKFNWNYFFLEAKDALWKSGYSAEKNFGIFNNANTLKCSNQQLTCNC